MTQTARAFPVLVSLLTVFAGLTAAVEAPAVIRVPVVTVFLLVCPGLAWVGVVPRLGGDDRWDALAVAIALSMTLTALVSGAMALTRTWNLGLGYGVLAAITLTGLLVQELRSRRERAETGQVAPRHRRTPPRPKHRGGASASP